MANGKLTDEQIREVMDAFLAMNNSAEYKNKSSNEKTFAVNNLIRHYNLKSFDINDQAICVNELEYILLNIDFFDGAYGGFEMQIVPYLRVGEQQTMCLLNGHVYDTPKQLAKTCEDILLETEILPQGLTKQLSAFWLKTNGEIVSGAYGHACKQNNNFASKSIKAFAKKQTCTIEELQKFCFIAEEVYAKAYVEVLDTLSKPQQHTPQQPTK